MEAASVTQIGQVPTRVFTYDGGKERTVRLTAQLRGKMQDIASRTNSGEIGNGVASNLSCVAIFGESFMDKVPFDRFQEVTDFAVEILREVLGVEESDDEAEDSDETTDAPEPTAEDVDPEEPTEEEPKNADAPPSEG